MIAQYKILSAGEYQIFLKKGEEAVLYPSGKQPDLPLILFRFRQEEQTVMD